MLSTSVQPANVIYRRQIGNTARLEGARLRAREECSGSAARLVFWKGFDFEISLSRSGFQTHHVILIASLLVLLQLHARMPWSRSDQIPVRPPCDAKCARCKFEVVRDVSLDNNARRVYSSSSSSGDECPLR